MLGLTKREIEKRFDEIVEFAELADFIDEPVKTYSSGMYMRLGFSVAINVDPDVLLVDEVLAVGDEGFTHKCLDKFADFKRRGKHRPARHAFAGPGRAVLRRSDLARRRPQAGRRRSRSASSTPTWPTCRQQEEQFLAASGRQGTAGRPARSSPAHAPRRATPGDPTADLPQTDRGPLGIGHRGDCRGRAARRAGPAAHVFQSGDPMRVRMTLRAQQAGR